jgi:hypothetical protein
MATKNTTHVHGEECGCMRMRHGDHFDYLREGRLHHVGEGETEEHRLEVTDENPADCRIMEGVHDHRHDPVVPHGDHVDYYYRGRLHHLHDDHCDDHGPIEAR